VPWRRHNRDLTHEVFYEGTTIDGSRLEKAMGLIEEKFNKVPRGALKNRFIAVQYHSGFNPQVEDAGAAHHFPWLEIRNQDTADVIGVVPADAPFNELRPLQRRLLEDRDLNIPVPAGSKVRLSIVLPFYNGGTNSWGPHPWYVQGFSTTLTALEEVQSL
jgi:hypothetical protein